ncbi:MAG: UDP-N-acetylmuramoyl-tripeptide--D-alanyl-D-alanine ligase [Deltaproteobacteria bacterium]|nr:UDP-N-acetylmuramoyl-tripeptide--D-alanyl-D-alanine ligase [Deltaproteobacteria bacterium]
MWHYKDILKATKGELIKLKAETFNGISTDSRTIKEGELFIPLKGKKHDGHDFIQHAMKNFGSGTLCEFNKLELTSNLDKTIIAVKDTNMALADVAYYKRKLMNSTFVAITGSCGKTTTKEVLVHIVKKSKTVAYNEKNYNNLFGVALSLVGIDSNPEVAIFELGTNAPGEIKTLTQVVEPDISVITNVRPSHLEGLKSISGVANEKLDIYRYTKEGGILFVNKDEDLIREFRDDRKRICYFGIKNPADFSLSVEKSYGWDGYEVNINLGKEESRAKVRLLGKHNLYNVLIAASIAYTLGIPKVKIVEALEEFGPYPMRMNPKKSEKGYVILDDTYNANPASMYEALRTFSELPCEGKKILVLGDMNELGEYSVYYHRDLGRTLNEIDFHYAFFFGEKIRDTYLETKKGEKLYFENMGELLDRLLSVLEEKDCVLIKGSRSLNLDLLVKEIG